MVCGVVVGWTGKTTPEKISSIFVLSPFKEAVCPGNIPNVGCPTLCHEEDFVKEVKYLGARLVDCADNGSPLAGERPHHLDHACSHHRVQPACRLVAKEESWIGQHLRGKGQPLHLTPGNPLEFARNPDLRVAAL